MEVVKGLEVLQMVRTAPLHPPLVLWGSVSITAGCLQAPSEDPP